MGVEWFRDLSIIILGVTTSAALIFITVLTYRLYRKANSAIQLAKSTAKIAYDTVAFVQQGPLASILTFIQGVRGGFQGISKIFKKESNKGENKNE
jgi:hypothetical protein